jgi:hypothetical protein
MLHPCPTQSACLSVFDLLSPPLLNASRSDSSRLYPSPLSAALSESALAHRPIRVGAMPPESASPSRVSRPDPSQPGRSESHGQPGSESSSESGASHPPIHSSHDGHRSLNNYLKGVRGYRATLPHSPGGPLLRGVGSTPAVGRA